METQIVKIENITLTRPTQSKTGLGENDLQILLTDARFKDQLNDLTVKIEMTQKREVSVAPTQNGGRRQGAISVAEALKGHSKVSSSDRVKRFWVNAMNVSTLIEKGIVVGADYGQLVGTVAYLLTEEYETAEFRDGRIVSSPKRKGKGGNILLSENGGFIFQDTQLVTAESDPQFEGFDYADFVKFENAAKIAFKDELDAAGIPDETKTDGFFAPEFEEWLTNEYASRNEKVLTAVS